MAPGGESGAALPEGADDQPEAGGRESGEAALPGHGRPPLEGGLRRSRQVKTLIWEVAQQALSPGCPHVHAKGSLC